MLEPATSGGVGLAAALSVGAAIDRPDCTRSPRPTRTRVRTWPDTGRRSNCSRSTQADRSDHGARCSHPADQGSTRLCRCRHTNTLKHEQVTQRSLYRPNLIVNGDCAAAPACQRETDAYIVLQRSECSVSLRLKIGQLV